MLSLVPLCSAFLKTSWEELRANPGYSFPDYVAEYGKTYDAAEYTTRQAIFTKQLRAIRTHNTQNPNWIMGLNHLSDWEETEVTQKMTGLSSGRQSFMGLEHGVHRLPADFKLSELPASLDWRNATPSVVTPIKEQGLCGSCWAFATTEVIESAVAIATGKLSVLGPQQLVSCAPNPEECGGTGGCSGSTPAIGFNYTIGVGLSLESSYPYTHRETACDSGSIQPVVGLTGYVNIPSNNATLLMHALTRGPVAISVAANWASYERGVFDGPHHQPCGYTVNHAVVVVGYGTDDATGLNYWTLRNSWTPQWGEHGYMRILRAANGVEEPCGLDPTPESGIVCKGDKTPQTYCGTCGLLSQSSYPTGVFNMEVAMV